MKPASPVDIVVELVRLGTPKREALALLTSRTVCPHCGHRGPVQRDFGVRRIGRRLLTQSWCRRCRSSGGRG